MPPTAERSAWNAIYHLDTGPWRKVGSTKLAKAEMRYFPLSAYVPSFARFLPCTTWRNATLSTFSKRLLLCGDLERI